MDTCAPLIRQETQRGTEMNRRVIAVAVLAIVCLGGCARLTIDQFTFQGDLTSGRHGRASIARGVAGALQSKLEARQLQFWSSKEFADRVGSVKLDDEGFRTLFPWLFEFTANAERLAFRPEAADLRAEIERDVTRLRSVIRFPGFDQISLIETESWQLINPVHVFGGLGRSEFIVVRED